MEKMPKLNDVFLSIMASFIGFGLVIGIAQAAFDFGGGRSLLLSSPVFAQYDPVSTATGQILPLEPCPAGQVFYSRTVVGGIAADGCQAGSCPTGYTSTPYADSAPGVVPLYQCKKNADPVVASTTVSNVCPPGHERTPNMWTTGIRQACTLAAQKLKLLDTQCIANAVEKRDNATLAGMDSHYTTLRNLVVVRARDLKNAWLQFSDRKARRAEIARVWNKYRTDIRYMQRQSSVLKTNTWKQFTIDRKACGTYATADDYTSAGVDSSLQMFAPSL